MSKTKRRKLLCKSLHVDKPFSQNNLKVIIPIKPISLERGGIKILDKKAQKRSKT